MDTNIVISDVDDLSVFLKRVQDKLGVVFVTGINSGAKTQKKSATKKSDEHFVDSRKFLFGTDFLKDADVRQFIKYQPIYLALFPKELIKEEFLNPAEEQRGSNERLTPEPIQEWVRQQTDLPPAERDELAEDLENYFVQRRNRIEQEKLR